MTAFEQSLVVVMQQHIEKAREAIVKRGAGAMQDPKAANELLADLHVSLLRVREGLEAMHELHEMAERIEKENAA